MRTKAEILNDIIDNKEKLKDCITFMTGACMERVEIYSYESFGHELITKLSKLSQEYQDLSKS